MIQKYLTWLTAVIENLFFAGIIFGWANLQPVLVKEGYFGEGCANFSILGNGSEICESQHKELSLVFTLGTSCGLFSTILVGSALDYLGIWTVRTVLVNIGVLALLVTGTDTSNVLYYTFPLLHVAGLGLHVTNLQMSKMFYKNNNMYVSSISGALMSGSLTFLIFSYLYNKYIISFVNIFTIYSVFYFFLNLRTFLLTPKNRAPEKFKENFKYGYKEIKHICIKGETLDFDNFTDQTVHKNYNKVSSFKTFARSLLFITTVLSNSIVNLIYMLYISTFNSFIFSLLQNKQEQKHKMNLYLYIFGIMQFTGILFSLLNGVGAKIFMGKKTEQGPKNQIRCCIFGLFIGSVCTVGMQICTIIPSVDLQLLSMILHVIGKAFFISSSNTFISIIFPVKMFGRLYSVMAVCQALFLMLQHPCILLLDNFLKGNFMIFNSCLTLVSLLSLAQPLYALYYYKTY